MFSNECSGAHRSIHNTIKLWFNKAFDIIPVRLNALKISERWCDYGMDKRSISQPRQARDKQLLNLVNDNSIPIRLNALRSFLNLKQKTLRGFHFDQNHATMRCSRARAQPLPLSISLYIVIHACAAAFFSFSLALALSSHARLLLLLCASSSPAGRARSHPTLLSA